MADNNKTAEEQLVEIDAARATQKTKEKAARAKKKADKAKADAEYQAQEETKARIAKENMQRASTDSAGNPQTESGKNAKNRAHKEELDKQKKANSKLSAETKYQNAIDYQKIFIERYAKSGKSEDRQSVINSQSKIDEAAKEYSDIVGVAPEGYNGKLNLPTAPTQTPKLNTNVKSIDVKKIATTPVDNTYMQNIEDKRLVSASSTSKIKIDPNAVNAYMAANPGATYDQAVASLYGGLINPLAGNGSNGSSGLPIRTVNVNKKIQTFTAQQLEGAATQYAQQLLGRALTANELASVTKFTNTEASKTPQVSRTVTNNNGTTSTSSVTSSGGIDEGQLIKSQIEQNPEYANYQKATTYFDSMLSSLRGPVGGGI
jgi:hypothetical protein